MNQPQLIELINKEIDGVNSKAESSKLKAYLTRHPEARQLYEELLKTALALRKVEELAPPRHLRQHILNSLEKNRKAVDRDSGAFGKVLEALRHRSMPRFALVFASGLSVGILLFVILTLPGELGVRDTSQLTGTMALVPELAIFQPADSVAFNLQGASGTIKTYFGTDLVIAEVRIQSATPVKTEIAFRPEKMTFSGFKRLQGDESSLDIGQNTIALTQSGASRGFVSFVSGGGFQGPLEVKISAGGRTLHHSTLQTRGANSVR
jgi:hypothetical protein